MRIGVWIGVMMVASAASVHAAALTLSMPVDYQVVQRTTKEKGAIAISGESAGEELKAASFEARVSVGEKAGEWQKLTATVEGSKFQAQLEALAGGWYRVEVRALAGEKVLGEAAVGHVGIGEVFVVAGQSNSANYGSARLMPVTGMVAACVDCKHWQPANDPQPGAGGGGGSFIPPLGDALVERFKVPVGFIACGVGSTSVRHWLPKGVRAPNAPTNAKALPNGQWESNGGLFSKLVQRMKMNGAHGFRAVLWHQGESDAHQADKKHTLPGKYYREFLEKIIVDSRREIGWDAPWFVALVSYHAPDDVGSEDIRSAQKALWDGKIALQGPDSDSLRAEFRDGVHFNEKGLRQHAALWAELVGAWLEKEVK